MNILGIDTSGLLGSAAVVCGKDIVSDITSPNPSHHSKKILHLIDNAISKSSITLSNIDGISVVTGPGSFTGVRIGIATSYGLAISLEKRLVGISALYLTAYSFSHIKGILCPLIFAGRDEVYTAFYINKGGTITSISDEMVLPVSKLLEMIKEPVTFIGRDVNRYRDILEEKGGCTISDVSVLGGKHSASAYAALIGAGRLKETGSSPINTISPNYIRPSDAEINLERKRRPLCH